jgi:tRNA-Thr(GGU) m(6)t(6)A37 methyltransferase TsaA
MVRSPRTEPLDDDWGDVVCTIDLLPPFGPDAVAGLEEFSHLEVVFVFDRVDVAGVDVGRRRPRGNPRWPSVGILAQRARNRPNRLGLCTCELLAVRGSSLEVRGLDAIDGTPVLDVKPYLREFAPRSPVRQAGWASELMSGYW